ncbi:MAG: hypothetical protein UY41_C0016G0003 [Candidatus Moranbacteria bacterium GW2011_GWE1_49_15]|nr:MAG: hypothetical protein UX75_C0023G0001 [Candidatus Moranbacteria bacterium GW2011_GWE2_47_10]KKW06733.1 MAG: hypothetical protein UY41_C0016G0003 [Candidatus Moranbacteria bacterium GW2011_GWE1_49_15]HBP00775.1 hypothetical protein [Candidatus Moranbacteria bacterium]
MESEKNSLRDWVSSFYLLKAIGGLREATHYSERTLIKVAMVEFLLLAVLLFIAKIYPEGNQLLGIAIFFILGWMLFNYGHNLTRKKFFQLAPSGKNLEAMITKTMHAISLLNADELAMLQDLADASNDKNLFLQKLEEALRHEKLGKIQFLKEISDHVDKNHAE